MKTLVATFLLTVIFSIIMLSFNYKTSGGDIFSAMMILGFALIEVILLVFIRIFYKIDFWNSLFGIILGLIMSYILFEIVNYISIR